MTSELIQQVNNCVNQLNDALVQRDAEQLKALTSEGLSYGHSKGKIESQDAFVGNVVSEGATQFVSIVIEDQTTEIVGDNAIVRHTFKAETNKNGKTGSLEIKNLLVWLKAGGQWKLIARQAFSF
ncbi:protein of unknown function [Alteromonadaceae bacterium Bs31]|nr:protein of unknown function [Alteromonadaceae bacterium Bs31]